MTMTWWEIRLIPIHSILDIKSGLTISHSARSLPLEGVGETAWKLEAQHLHLIITITRESGEVERAVRVGRPMTSLPSALAILIIPATATRSLYTAAITRKTSQRA